MKKFFVFIFMVALGLGSAFAQGGGPGGQRMSPEERLKRDMDQMTEKLSLTADQVAKITPMVKESSEKQREMFQKMRDSGEQPDMEKMREQRTKSRNDLDAKINAVLTKDQQSKLVAFRKEQDEQMRQRMQNRQ
jgi:periplasmic protein CpxP/Spy